MAVAVTRPRRGLLAELWELLRSRYPADRALAALWVLTGLCMVLFGSWVVFAVVATWGLR